MKLFDSTMMMKNNAVLMHQDTVCTERYSMKNIEKRNNVVCDVKRTIAFSMIFLLIVATAGCINNNSKIVGEWELESYGAEVVIPALPDVNTSIQFDEDGKFNGNVGCNSFGGNYNLNGDRIFFNSIQSTMMYCEETWNQEQTVLQVFSQPNLQIQLNNDSLSIVSINGLYIVNLVKK